MKLRMKKSMAGPEFAVMADDLWECPDDKLAHQLIEDGQAEEVDEGAAGQAMDKLRKGVPHASAREGEADRRTADELAADALAGVVLSADPYPAKTSDEMAADEAAAKVAAAQAATVDPKGSAHQKVVNAGTAMIPPPPITTFSPTPTPTPSPTSSAHSHPGRKS